MKRCIFLLLSTMIFNIECSNPSNFDTSFAQPNGYTTNQFGATAVSISQIKVQSDGKIVIAGNATINSVYNILVARYLTDGTLDPDFGTTGYTTTPITDADDDVQIFGLDIEESSGNIVVAGSAGIAGVAYGLVAQYLPDGTINSTNFASPNGYTTALTFTSGIILSSVVIQPNSSIVVTGWIGAQASNNGMITARYLSDGSLDTAGFGNPNGYVAQFNPANTQARAESVGLQSDGSIIVAGWITVNGVNQITLVRYTSAGVLDPTFNSPTGYVSNSISGGSIALAIKVLRNDSILATGYGSESIIISKFTADGEIDTSFGDQNGYITTTFPNATSSSSNAIAVQSDTKILIAGSVNYSTTPTTQCFIARYYNDGSLDTTFNSVGYIILAIDTPSSSTLHGVAVQDDQKIVAAGYISTTESLVMRLLGGKILESTTVELELYGVNPDLFQEFLYVNFYAQSISNSDAQQGTIDIVDAILNQYALDYADQSNFNYASYTYLLHDEFALAEIALITEYGNVGISQFFINLNERINHLSTAL